ncbi:MAG: hypothetical protein MUD13_02545 [Candidatus Nanopelagicales bacterium]|jgi:ElaB/YqjD/DUF883 family membrane-anchored ribosome-binding protein|nr:hypothetical protein [Candidatus Nanopelagicales bacterium]
MERLESSQSTPQDAQGVEVVDVTDATLGTRQGSSGGGVEQAKERAVGTAQEAKEQAKGVATDAKEQAISVVQSATEQTKGLVSGVGQQVSSEVESQKGRLVQLLREIGDELDQAAGRTEGADGRVAMVASEAATRTREASTWLESHQARDLVDSVSDFARRRPMVFIAGSAIAGMVVGRLTRGMVDAARDESAQQGSSTTFAAGAGTGTIGEAPVGGYGSSVPASGTGVGAYGTDPYGTDPSGTPPMGTEPISTPDQEPYRGTGTPGTLGGLR